MTNGAGGEPSRESLLCGYSIVIKGTFPFMAAPKNLTNNGAPQFIVDVKTTDHTEKNTLWIPLHSFL